MSRSKPKRSKKSAPVTAAQAVDTGAGGRAWLRPWMLVAIVVLLTAAVRIHLLGIPLERDEGEYAYGGQLLLHGIPPYKILYSMKFPGVYAAYALMIGIHLGFMVVNAAAIVLIYLLGKRLISPVAGVAASAAYALLSIGQDVVGTQAHATHFVVLAALGGTLLLLRGIENRRWPTLLWSGVLLGVAVLMKQHGVLFVGFGAAYLALDWFIRRREAWRAAVREMAIFFCGVSIPLALTGIALWRAGVFHNFWFWTFTYAREYEQELNFSAGLDVFSFVFPRIVTPNLAIWIIAVAGLVLIWWRKESRMVAVFVTGFLVFSFLAVCPGFYFRNHYFVLMLPAIALLAGAAIDAVRKQWPRISWLTYCAYIAALAFSVMQQQEFLFQMSPIEISRAMYLLSPFPEAIQIADYIQAHSATDARIAILGSEPEIPFYAHRRSATGYIYMYGLLEPQPYAIDMQDEFIHDIESSQPEYVVFVKHRTSWMQVTKIASYKILDWWAAYQPHHYKQLVGIADIIDGDHTEYRWGADAGSYQLQSPTEVLIYKRTDPADDPMARMNHAEALAAQGKLDEAAQENLQVFALTLDPKNYNAYNNLGILLAKRGELQEALSVFQRSLAIKPDQALAHYDIGLIQMERHQLPEAVDEFVQALRINPADDNAHNDLGIVLAQGGDFENAAEQFSEAVRFNPANADARRNLGFMKDKLKSRSK